MKRFILFGACLNVSLMAFEWEHVSGMCDAKIGEVTTLTLAHIHSLEKPRQQIDIITFDTISDELYDELKEEYAHFYIGTRDLVTACIASKYPLNPSMVIKNEDVDYYLDDGSAFEVILAAAKDAELDEGDEKKTVKSGGWEISAKADVEGNVTLEGNCKYKQKNENGSTEVSGSIAISRDDQGNTDGEVKIILKQEF